MKNIKNEKIHAEKIHAIHSIDLTFFQIYNFITPMDSVTILQSTHYHHM